MSTQTTLNYRTNRDLFSNYHLDEHLPETEAWDQVDDDELQAAYDEIKQLWEREKDTAPKRNESQLEDSFIRPMFRKLGIPFEVEESTKGTQRRPDYGFFKTQEDGVDAFQRREEGGDFYKNAVAVADAKRWGRKLDTRGKKKRDYENPSHQIDQYLRFTSTTWGVLTNGQKWRLYYKPTSHRLDSYYEIDLPTVLEQGDLEDFKYFYLFFRHDAFIPDTSGDAFLDDVYEESNVFAQELGEDLQDNIYEAIKLLAEGYLQYPENDLGEEDLELIHNSSLIYLYRIIFVLYAEAEGRDLLDTNNEIYESQYSLNQLKQEVADELESGDPKYRDWQSNLQSRLDELFMLIDQGSKSRGIPEEDLYIPAYNGGLFRTDPDDSGSDEALFLANHTVGDEHLARVIELLTRSEGSNGGGKIFVDYSSLDVRHLGSIYEGLLEYQLNVADEPLAIDDGEYVVADESSDVVVERDDVYLTTDSGERKATGSYYTPEYVVEYIVDETLRGPVDEIRKDVVMDEEFQDGGYAEEFAERVFDLRILDPAMGSGHFLTSVVDYLARKIITEQNREAEKRDGKVIDDEHDINWARRKVAQNCIYGVDINPLATELAKVSLWLRTLAAEQPLAFLDHHLKTGNSLIGSDITTVLSNNSEQNDGQLTLSQSFARARQQTLGHVMDLMTDLLAIDNEKLKDIKSMEELYDEICDDAFYKRLFEIANVHTAEQFGVDVPDGAYKEMAGAVDESDAWGEIQEREWFKSAQILADEQKFYHWELEFPEVFFGDDGEKLDGAGFDAVIGNPPWGHPGEQKDYLKNKYSKVVKRLPDVFSYFVYHSIRLTKDSGDFGMIVPNVSLFQSEYAKLRSELISSGLKQVIDLGENVFDQVVAPATILICDLNYDKNVIKISNMRENEQIALNNQMKSFEYNVDNVTSDDNYTIPVYNIRLKELMIELKKDYQTMGDTLQIEQGIQTGGDDRFTVTSSEIQKYDLEEKFVKPTLFGSDIVPYLISNSDQYVLYILRATEPDEISNIIDYLTQYKDKLSSVSEVEKGIRPWYSLHRPRDPETFEQKKILLRQTSDTLKAAYDPNCHFNIHSLLCVSHKSDQPGKIDLRALTCILNSTLLREFYSTITQEQDRVFAEVKAQNIKKLPLPTSSSEILISDNHLNDLKNLFRDSRDDSLLTSIKQGESILSVLSNLYPARSSMEEKRMNLNLNLLDHLGSYDDGPPLVDIGLPQPPTESANSILQQTTEQKPNLRVGEANVVRESPKTVEIQLTARYKPEDEDNYETDRWGYTETDPLPALRITDLTEMEANLIEVFVPVAVDEAGGFADFRETATKTNSLVDRLRKLTLPALSDVEARLDNYIQTKERANELDEKIEKTDQLIDEIVYDLYELTDEEIEIVESAVADD